ncbi:hypothetical protein NB550_22090 [Vibrio parahaemolyticus]|uniref:hypothetical protein n=1 Tax=Vibrio parahaemolyticus TaxID=670 RepID=UPI0004729520|nr:hypothetical protein [Vibrio parahaemolyticus]EGR0065755.1 hypothetical protein [Vibrio parahaemolyticus]EGR3322419.1 hypothetical protein [Vibrio parahaemolyticus]EKH9208965.1 hypothetical protein [Vibrio parahaemolyticus]MBY4651761.1 hypothetical protein [Vibrio parahaemolyticus]MCR9765613.1 hypothetical protein [Vibrio parahaemolyticus]
MAKKGVIYGQDKNYKGKLPTKELGKAINKLKKRYQDHSDDTTEVIGFEVNGGEGLTKTGYEEMEKFKKWAENKGMDAEYNSNEDLDKMKNNLRNRVDNKNNN